jgi:hypothetical protein
MKRPTTGFMRGVTTRVKAGLVKATTKRLATQVATRLVEPPMTGLL